MLGFPSAILPGRFASVLRLKGCDPISYRLMDPSNSNISYFLLYIVFAFAIYKEMQLLKILFANYSSPLIVNIICAAESYSSGHSCYISAEFAWFSSN
jgi:hypothetical protein